MHVFIMHISYIVTAQWCKCGEKKLVDLVLSAIPPIRFVLLRFCLKCPKTRIFRIGTERVSVFYCENSLCHPLRMFKFKSINWILKI